MAPPPPTNLDTIRLRIEGMTCGSCVSHVENALSKVPGVAAAQVNLTTEIATVTPVESGVTKQQLIEAVRRVGYDAETFRQGDRIASGLQHTQQSTLRQQRQALGQAIGLAVPIFALHWLAPILQGGHQDSPIWPVVVQAILCLLLLASPAGAPILAGGFRALVARRGNMDLLISLGVTAAVLSGLWQLFIAHAPTMHFNTAAMILTFINIGRYLEIRAKHSAASSISALVQRIPLTALRIEDDGPQEVRIERIHIGDHIRAAQDTIIAIDGQIIEGQCSVDESVLTGESALKPLEIGDNVLAGSRIAEGLVTIQATHVGADSAMGRIIRAVEDAQAGKTKMQRIADQVAGVFVPIVIAIALLTIVGLLLITDATLGTAINRAVAVLVIACPCAMGLATPTAIMVATSSAALRGILVRDAAGLERAAKLDCILFDKTGTLTVGQPAVTHIDVLHDDATFTENDVLTFAAAANQYAQHPIAKALVAEAKKRNLSLADPETFSSTPGRGVSAKLDSQHILVGSARFLADNHIDLTAALPLVEARAAAGQTAVLLAVENRCVGVIGLSDKIVNGAAAAIAAIHKRGITTAMLTGDNASNAKAIALQLGITDVISEMTPTDKLDEVRRRQENGLRVGFVGDGINDAPALTAAHVGLTFASATDIAASAADITIVHHDIGNIQCVIDLSQRSVRIIKQNLFWAFFYNLLAIPLAVLGIIPPGLAAIAMMCSSISVVLNSLRLRS